jgi:hypothetical protein
MGISTFSQQTVNSGLSDPVGSGNAVINGAFDIWQRGTSGFAGTSYNYGADRWLMVRASFAAGMSVSRQAAGLTEFEYCLRLQRISGNTNTGDINIFQAFESRNSIPFAGKTVTLSFYARAGANYSAPGSVLISTIHRGTGIDQAASAMSYAWTGGVGTLQSNVVTTSWTRYTQTLALPSNTTQIGVAFSSGVLTGTAGAADFVEITGVQLEAGPVATPFKRHAPGIAGELAACQRYYEKSYNLDVTPGTDTNNGAVYQGVTGDQYGSATYTINFKVTKRVTPSLSTWSNSGVGGVFGYHRSGVGDTNAGTNWTGGWPGVNGGMVYLGIGASHVTCTIFGQWAASAEL